MSKRIDLTALVVAAGLYAAYSALMSVNLDVSVFYNAAIRQLAGQRLYSDFDFPHVPLPSVIFGAFLTVMPTGGIALMVLTALSQITATLCIWRLVSKATASRRFGLLAGVFTAFWFITPLGGFHNDHLSYLLALIAAVIFVGEIPSPYKEVLFGICAAFAFYAKQTTGALATVALGMAVLLSVGWRFIFSRQFVWMCVSYVATHLAVLGCIALYTDFAKFLHDLFILPIDALERENKNPWRLLLVFVQPYFIDPVRAIVGRHLGALSFYPLVLVIYAAYVSAYVKRKCLIDASARFVFVFLLTSTLLCSALVGRAFAELTWGLGGLLALVLWMWRDSIPKTVATLMIIGFAGIGVLHFAVHRQIFAPRIPYNGFDIWPIQMEATTIQGNDAAAIVRVIEFLRSKEGDFAVLDEELYLVPLALRRAPVNPTVYYVPGETVPTGKIRQERWQRRFVEGIAEARFIVAKKEMRPTFRTGVDFGPKYASYAPELPLIRDFIAKRYRPVFGAGPFFVFERQ